MLSLAMLFGGSGTMNSGIAGVMMTFLWMSWKIRPCWSVILADASILYDFLPSVLYLSTHLTN